MGVVVRREEKIEVSAMAGMVRLMLRQAMGLVGVCARGCRCERGGGDDRGRDN